MRVDTGRLRVVETVEPPEPNPRRKRRPAAVADARTPEPEQRSPGAYLQHQRKQRGMSLDQLAAMTKIPRGQLQLLEADRFEELPGMVFAKGFLRCCARALELDPDTVLGLLYERERERLRARRRETSSATTVGSQSGQQSGQSGRPSHAGRLARMNRGQAGQANQGSQAGRSKRSAPRKQPRGGTAQAQVQAWIVNQLGRIPSARILMWLVVALLVAVVVLIAFTLASGQAETMLIRS